MNTRVRPILVLTLGAAIAVGCGRVPLDDAVTGSAGKGATGGSGSAGKGATGGSGSAGTGAGGAMSLPPCDGLDQTACGARPDCRADFCQACGQTTFFCDPATRPPPACPVHTCIRQSCTGLDEMMCGAAPGCTSFQCPDCHGGQVFAGCAAPGEQIDCGPCPPACSTLDAATCGTRADCHVGTCSTCGQVFSSCLGPNEEAACPQLFCPPPSSCAGVDIFGCNARPWCTPVQCPDCMGGQVYAGCVGAGEGISCAACPTSPCPFPVNIGCFSGAVCASAQVQAVCVHGEWRCPVGATSTEHCPSPDGGLDVGAGQ